jgi:hypothetical protein
MTGKSTWVPSRTQGVVLIVVADGQMYYGYCINCLYPAMGDNWDQWQWSLRLSYPMLLWTMTTCWHCIWTKCVCGFKTTCFRYVNLNLGCNNFLFWTPMYSTVVANFMYYMTVATKLVRSWLECWLVGNPSWFHGISGCTGLSLGKSSASVEDFLT